MENVSVTTEGSDDRDYFSDLESEVSNPEQIRSKSPRYSDSGSNDSRQETSYDKKLSRLTSANSQKTQSTTRRSERESHMNTFQHSADEHSRQDISNAESHLSSHDSSLSSASGSSRLATPVSDNRALKAAAPIDIIPKSVSHQIASDLSSRKTPYGHVISTRTFLPISKSKSARSGFSKYSTKQQKVDPITARILSANQKRRAIAGNQAGEIKKKNIQLYEEIKSLRILCKNQEKSLKQFENTQSALPRVLQNFEQDKAILKERLRKVRENEKRLEREKKRLDIENDKNLKKLKELNNIVQTKNLDERYNLQQQLTAAENKAKEAIEYTNEITKKYELQNSALERQLKKEIRRRSQAEQENQKNLQEVNNIKVKLSEKEKQLTYSNIYIQRQTKKGNRQTRSSSLALPESSPRSESQKTPDELNGSEKEVILPEKPPISPVLIEKAREVVVEPTEPPVTKKKTADAMLDEMLFGPKKVVKEEPRNLSPLLFDLDEKPKMPKVDSVPAFEFGGANVSSKSSKDTILAQLRDLHGNNSPEKERGLSPLRDPSPIDVVLQKESKPRLNFNIFDEAPPPKMDPKEIPKSKEDELDELLNLGGGSNTMFTNKSNRTVYNFTETINNLHEGKASSGKDYRKENIIDNLFGGGGNGNHGSSNPSFTDAASG